MKKCEAYISQIERIVGGNRSDSTTDLVFSWTSHKEAHDLMQHLKRMQQKLRAVTVDINQACHEMCAELSVAKKPAKRRLRSGMVAAVFGRKAVGTVDTVLADQFRNAQIDILAPYVRLKKVIDDILDQLDQAIHAVETSEEYSNTPSDRSGKKEGTDGCKLRQQRYYAFLDGEVVGPFSVEELGGLVKAKVANADTNICIEGEQDWHQLSHVYNQ